MKAQNKVIVVTGAGNGIGRELCLLLLQKQAIVAGVDLNPEALAETQKIAGVGDDRFKGFVLDITDKAKVDALPGEVAGHFGAVDGLINNAGIIQKFSPVNDLTMEQINRVMNVNFFGTLNMTKAFLPLFLERPEAHIVNISSMGGFIAFPGQTIYGAAKAAVKIFTEGLYAELKDSAVRVTVVHPGAIATNITANSGLGGPKIDPATAKTGLALPAVKAAKIIVGGMERNKFRVTVGKDAGMLDLLYRLNPRFATNFIGKMMKKTLKHM
jgi:NAD(P)-dependent dehydrogenase (short-subunit alcohol dehydrogenase family)